MKGNSRIIETQLDQLKQMGDSAYLSEQVG